MTDDVAPSTTAPARALRVGVARGRLRVPPSKSVSHRQLALALLARAPVEVRHPLAAEDIDLFLGVLRGLGWSVADARPQLVRLAPGPAPAAATFHCGNAGTLLRFLVALLSTIPGEWTLDGSARLRERPVGPLVAALRELGVAVRWHGVEGCPPLTIAGGTLRGGEATVDAGESSQYLSALLLAALGAPAPTRIRVAALTSAPYVEVTLRLVEQWGGQVARVGDGFVVAPGLTPRAAVEVEGDFSAAAYPAAAAALTGGEVTLLGLERGSAQGDRGFLDLLAAMGAEVTWDGDVVRVRGTGALDAVDADLGAMPDQVPTLAAIAPFARGTTRIRNVSHLRIKESDRLAAMAAELRRAGAAVAELPDGLVVSGDWAGATVDELPAAPVVLDAHGDHRIAMAMALVGLRRRGLAIAEPEVVGKSYPGFWGDLDALLERRS
jgi:3-phosphoshikimate 1-carboxyvinyltransferase